MEISCADTLSHYVPVGSNTRKNTYEERAKVLVEAELSFYLTRLIFCDSMISFNWARTSRTCEGKTK